MVRQFLFVLMLAIYAVIIVVVMIFVKEPWLRVVLLLTSMAVGCVATTFMLKIVSPDAGRQWYLQFLQGHPVLGRAIEAYLRGTSEWPTVGRCFFCEVKNPNGKPARKVVGSRIEGSPMGKVQRVSYRNFPRCGRCYMLHGMYSCWRFLVCPFGLLCLCLLVQPEETAKGGSQLTTGEIILWTSPLIGYVIGLITGFFGLLAIGITPPNVTILEEL